MKIRYKGKTETLVLTNGKLYEVCQSKKDGIGFKDVQEMTIYTLRRILK